MKRYSVQSRLRYIVCMLVMGILLLLEGRTAYAANPRLILSDYSIREERVTAGKKFMLTLTVNNTSKSKLKNIKISCTTENGELIPAKGAGTAYLAELAAGKEDTVSFRMQAAENLEEKSYKLSVKTEYEGNGNEYTVEDAIFIPVYSEQRISVTDVFVTDESVQLGETVEVTGKVNNLGNGMLHNVTVRIYGDNVDETTTYVGNIEAGKSASIDLLAKATVVTNGNKVNNRIEVTYEDSRGTAYTQESQVKFSVAEPDFENLEKVQTESKTGKNIAWIIGSIAAAVCIVVFVIWRKRVRRRKLDAFMG